MRLLVAPPVAGHRERVYQVFGRETLDQLIPLAAVQPLERVGLPQPPPWRRARAHPLCARLSPAAASPRAPVLQTGASATARLRTIFGDVRLHGFVSKPEIQKLNRNSIFIFVNGRLIRDRLIQHAITEAYRNILPPTVFPVVLLFIEMPTAEVDVNVHPSKTEVRFRQQTVIHDFVRESVRAALMKARPVPQFLTEIGAQPSASPGPHSPACESSFHRRRARQRWFAARPMARLVRAGDGGRICAAGAASSRGDRAPSNLKAELPSRRTRRYRWRARRRQPSRSRAVAVQRDSRSRLRAANCARAATPRRLWSRCAPCAPWARFEIRSFSRSMKTASGSSISMWRTSAYCSSESCGNARRSRWRASACSCRWSSS